MTAKNISMTMLISALSGMHDFPSNKSIAKVLGFKHQDLTNTASQPPKSSYNSKQRKKSKRKGSK